MNLKLEKRLQEVNCNSLILCDEDLKRALDEIIDAEVEKPIEEMDTELVDVAVEYKLLLEGISPEEVEAASEKHVEAFLSDFHGKAHKEDEIKVRKKIAKPMKWVIAVAAAVVAMTATIVGTGLALDFDLMDLKEFLGLTKEVEHSDGDYSLTITDTRKDYTSFEDFLNNEDVEGLLLPTENVTRISIVKEPDSICTINLTMYDAYFVIKYKTNVNTDGNDHIQIGDYKVAVVDFDQKIQGIWAYKGNSYYVTVNSMEQLVNIINNLKEY